MVTNNNVNNPGISCYVVAVVYFKGGPGASPALAPRAAGAAGAAPGRRGDALRICGAVARGVLGRFWLGDD